MTVQIRQSVFETNSSSSHSLTLANTELVRQPFSTDVLRAGCVVIGKGEYGWEWHRYFSAENKLSYLLTQAHSDDIPRGSLQSATAEVCEDPRLALLVKVVRDYTGVEVLFSPGSSGYIDHDSVGVGTELLNDEEKLRQFLFSDAYVETGNDNSGPGWTISTDRGDMYYYEPSLVDTVPEGYVPYKLIKAEAIRATAFATGAGGLLKADAANPLYREVLEKGIVTSAHWVCEGSSDYFRYEEVRGYTAREALGMGSEELGHLKLLRGLTATYEYQKGDGYAVTGTLVVQLPPELAGKLNELDPKAFRKAQLAEVKRMRKYWEERLKAKPDDNWAKNQVAKLDAQMEKLGARRKSASTSK